MVKACSLKIKKLTQILLEFSIFRIHFSAVFLCVILVDLIGNLINMK